MHKSDFRIIFMGTPEFAVPGLDALLNAGFHIAGVITAPDKPAGRGRAITSSPVKNYALSKGLKTLQPAKLKDPQFLEELASLQPHLQVVVAFRMLPEAVWALPSFGTINLHASLLPQYRGAAPVNWAIINGEKETGVTTFFIRHEIDTGNLLFQEKVEIGPDETAGELHDKLMTIGARLLTETVTRILEGNFTQTNQTSLVTPGTTLKPAPKINPEDCLINWNNTTNTIFNFIRGLSPYPGAWCELINDKEPGKISLLKIFKSVAEHHDHPSNPGKIITDGRKYFKICTFDGFIDIQELQLAGKKKMGIKEFLRGVRDINNYRIRKVSG